MSANPEAAGAGKKEEADPSAPAVPPVNPAFRRFLPNSLRGWADACAKLGAVFLVIFGVVQYLEAQRATRVARTQDLMTRYATDPIHASRIAISAVLRDNLEIIKDFRRALLNPEASRQAHEDLVAFLVHESNNGAGLAGEIDDLVNFFGAVDICVEHGLCEESVAVAYFGGDAGRLFENFKPYIDDRRVLDPEYARALESFVSRSAEARS